MQMSEYVSAHISLNPYPYHMAPILYEVVQPGLQDINSQENRSPDQKHPQIGEEIEELHSLSDTLINKIIDAVKEYKSQVVK